MVVLAILNIIAALYVLYLTAQHVANRRRVFWRGLVYTAVLYLYSFGYVMLHNVDGILFMAIMYILAILDLKLEAKTEEDGA